MTTHPVSSPVKVAVVGLGYWGPNLARNFDALPEAELAWICDGSDAQLASVAPRFPHARVSTCLDDVLDDPALDAVVIATPVRRTPPLLGRSSPRASIALLRSR